MATKTNRDITADFRGAIIEAKESMEGKRKLNTLDKLIEELRLHQNERITKEEVP